MTKREILTALVAAQLTKDGVENFSSYEMGLLLGIAETILNKTQEKSFSRGPG